MGTYSINYQKIILEPTDLDSYNFIIEQLNLTKERRIDEFILVKKPAK